MLDQPVWIDGRIVPGGEAVVHVMTPSLHYGWGAYDGIRFHAAQHTEYGSSVFRAADHVVRFRRSNRALGIDIGFSDAELLDAIRELVGRAPYRSGYLRPVSYLRPGKMSIFSQLSQPSVAIGCWEWPDYLTDTERGLRVRTSSVVRSNPAQVPTSAKTTGGYLNPALARFAAVGGDEHETILLNDRGRVAEAAAANVFLVTGGSVITPPVSEGILPGITRDTLIILARALGLVVTERPVDPGELWTADELFLTGTAMGINGVVRLDGRPIGDGTTGAVTGLLATAYRDAVTGAKYTEYSWTEPVGPRIAR